MKKKLLSWFDSTLRFRGESNDQGSRGNYFRSAPLALLVVLAIFSTSLAPAQAEDLPSESGTQEIVEEENPDSTSQESELPPQEDSGDELITQEDFGDQVQPKGNSSQKKDNGNGASDKKPSPSPTLSPTPEPATPSPTPVPNDPIITVHGGGLRTGSLSVGGVPNGAVFEAVAVSGSPSGGPFVCTVDDGSGSCDINVPGGFRWDVALIQAPAGYYLNPTLDYGGSSTVSSDTYSFRTGIVNSDIEVPGSNPNGTYSDVRHPGDNYFSGLLAASLSNPPAIQRCGLDVALVLDQSGSMSGAKQTSLKAAANDAIDALTGTPSQLAIYTFATSAGSFVDATSTSTVTSAEPLHSFVNALPTPSGLTNWDAGIYQVPAGFDIAIVLTDGAPTTYDSSMGAGGDSYFKFVEEGIFSSNALKSLGTRVVAVGIGINGAEANLRSISGPTSGSDYYLASNENFDDVLKELATGSCNNQLSIQKQIVDPLGSPIPNSDEANGWTFDSQISEGTIDAQVVTGVVNDQNGFASAQVAIPVGSTPTLSITENTRSGYSLDSVECSVGGVPVQTQLSGSTVSFVGASDQPMSCIFINKQNSGAWTLTKSADPSSGTAVLEGGIVTYTLTATNNSDVPVVGATATDDLSDVLDNATLGTLPDGLQLSGDDLLWSIGTIGANSSTSISFSVTVDAGNGGQYLINVASPGSNGTCVSPLDCETSHPIVLPNPILTLQKVVLNSYGGDAEPTQWTLQATGPDSISGASGDSSITGVSVAEGTYTLSEIGPFTTEYQWASLQCISDGRPVEGVNIRTPLITLENGEDVTCTFINSDVPATLTLEKIVDNNDANSTNVPSDFTLTATPLFSGDQSVISGSGDPQLDGINAVQIFAGSYRLSESGPAGFEPGQWQCAGGELVGDILTVKNGEPVHCRITNTALDPILTLIKYVDNGATGGVGTPQDWVLSADGRASGGPIISGTTGEASITNAFVPVGTYTLSEEGDLTGYTSSQWVCDNGSTGPQVTLLLAETVTCTITNTATAPLWSVEKSSDPASGATVMPGDEVTYTVTLDHLGGVVPSSTTVTDDVSDVLDNASWVDVSVSSGSAVLEGTTLTWSPGMVYGSATMTYSVIVNEGAYGEVLRNVVTPPEGGQCSETCSTEHPIPHFMLEKTSNPATGSLVYPGESITYTLRATNDSMGALVGAWATDDLSSVLTNSTLVTPLAEGLSFDADSKTLRWDIPALLAGADSAVVEYTITISGSAAGATISNVVVPGEAGECVPAEPRFTRQPVMDAGCSTSHEVRSVDVAITKGHTFPLPDDAVESGNGSLITYGITVENLGELSPRDDATSVVVTDQLPPGLTYDLTTLVAPDWDTSGTTENVLRATYVANGGVMVPGAMSTIFITAIVGDLEKPGDNGPFSDLVNQACVSISEQDSALQNNCSLDSVNVKWVELDPEAQCVNNVPAVNYSIPLFNGATTPTVTMIWWTPQGYLDRDPTIPTGDEAALIADGAQAIQNIPVPADWVNGESITGVQLWPGASVDGFGNPTAWPGWSQNSSGAWFLDPANQFYPISSNAVIEVRITSAVSSQAVSVEMVSGCNPSGLNARASSLTLTGIDLLPLIGVMISLSAIGVGLVWWSRRRKEL